MTEKTETSDSLLVVLDVPTGVEFGIDCITYETGPKFKGLSMVPTGIHFVYHGTGMGARQGFFIIVGHNEIAVKVWESTQEEILPRHNLSEESLNNLKTSIMRGELNSFLGPYPFQQHHTWKNVTNFITLSVLNRADCSPETLLYPGDESDLTDINHTNITKKDKYSKKQTTTEIKTYFPDTAHVANYTNIELIEIELIETIPQGSNRSNEITSRMLDKTILLEYIINNIYLSSNEDLLGELQLSFIFFMLLYSYPSLKQWKLLIFTICSSEKYLQNNQNFTSAFIRILFNQLNFVPIDFFENELSKDNFLLPCIKILFSSLNTKSLTSTLIENLKRLKLFLQKKFNLYNIDIFNSIDIYGNIIKYEENDLYDRNDDDLPTFVSMEEINSYYSNNSSGSSNSGSGGNNMQITQEDYMNMSNNMIHMNNIQLNNTTTTGSTGSSSIGDHGNSTGINYETAEYITKRNALETALSSMQTNTQPQEIYNSSSSVNSENRLNMPMEVEAKEDSLGSLIPGQVHASTNSGVVVNNTSNDSKTHEHTTTTTASGTINTPILPPQPPLTPAERESMLFSWRYPLLYESMLLTSGREDMVMAAIRIVEEGIPGMAMHNSSEGGREIADMRYKEALRFLEYEVGGQN